MANISQLIKKDQEGISRVYPRTHLDAVIDKNTGITLRDILSSLNMYFIPFQGNRERTRLYVPISIRRNGLFITYVNYDDEVIIEWYDNPRSILDDDWSSDSNWRDGSNTLVGDLSISSNGNWVIDGVETQLPARGESAYEIAVSKGYQGTKDEWLLSLRGQDGVSPLIRWNNNGIEQSTDNGKTWVTLSDKFNTSLYIKGYVSEVSLLPKNALIGDIYGVGPSYDTGDTEHTKPYYQLYVNTVSSWNKDTTITEIYESESELPLTSTEGSTAMVSGSSNSYLIYRYKLGTWSLLINLDRIYDTKEDILNTGNETFALVKSNTENQYDLYESVVSWVNFGTYNSISAGIVQEPGDLDNVVMSQKAVTDFVNGKSEVLSEDEYDALEEKDKDKFYFIYEE